MNNWQEQNIILFTAEPKTEIAEPEAYWEKHGTVVEHQMSHHYGRNCDG